MSDLKKATLFELNPDGTLKDPNGTEVQFNPATMRLQISNATEGGESRGRQVRQHLGKSSTTLTLDLIFDTADEGTTSAPRSVRDRTAIIEKYVLPASTGEAQEAPPQLRFQWGPFILNGVVDSINIDIDHFAGDGTPLRAKVGLSLKEQDSKYLFPATTNPQTPPEPGQPPAGQPGSGPGASTQSAAAIGGESAADFAARMGLDPSSWRGLDIGASASLSLDAGLEVGFSADLSVSAGLGVTVGFEAGVSASIEASVGLDVSASVGVSATASFGASVSAGIAVASAGGVSAAIAQAGSASAAAAVNQTAQAFGQSLPAGAASAVSASPAAAVASPPPAQLGPPPQSRTPLTQSGLPTASQQAAAPSAPPLPRADPRATSFGFGVPLRSQLGIASNQRVDLTAGGATLGSQVGTGDPPTTTNPTIPPWIALPASEFAMNTAGVIQMKKRSQPSCGCGCSGGSRCRRH
jgi:hypothetical protein